MDFLTSKISRKKLDKLISAYATNAKTLEVGAWGGQEYGRFFPNKIGVDIREGKGVDLVADVYQLPFKNDEFDTVLCVAILEHLEYPRKAISEMHRVLKSGGIILISVPFMFPIHDAPNDYWRFTKYGLKKLFVDGWHIEVLKAETNTQEFFATIIQRLGYQSKMKLNKPAKILLFLLARIIEKMPNIFSEIYGDITKKSKEPDAFTSSFFLVAKKT